jgi:uncharacterized protein
MSDVRQLAVGGRGVGIGWNHGPFWMGGVRRDPQRVQRVLRSLARNISTEAEITTIAKDSSLPPDGAAVGRLTVDDYLDAFARWNSTTAAGEPSRSNSARTASRKAPSH